MKDRVLAFLLMSISTVVVLGAIGLVILWVRLLVILDHPEAVWLCRLVRLCA